MLKHKIKKKIIKHCRYNQKQYEQYEYLYYNHIELHQSIAEIAQINNVNNDVIQYHLKKNHIVSWEKRTEKTYSEDDINTMIDMYCNKNLSANQIAKHFHTSHTVILRHLKRRNIQIRNLSESQYNYNNVIKSKDLENANLLYQLHWEDRLSCKDIAKKYNIDPKTVKRYMNNMGIKTKNDAESKIGLMIGDKHPNWKGGITPLNALLREYFTTNQLPYVAQRDNYTCQLCGKTHTILHVHHIIPFSNIVKKICDENSDLCPNNPSDKIKLYEIITHDDRFLNTDNLITLCRDCHLYKIHNYNKTISNQAQTWEGSETISKESTP